MKSLVQLLAEHLRECHAEGRLAAYTDLSRLVNQDVKTEDCPCVALGG